MKKLLVISSFLFTQFAFAQTCDQHFFNGLKPVSKNTEVLCKSRFAVGYSQKNKTLMWTSSHLTAQSLQSEEVKRKDTFKPDPSIPATSQSQISAYVGTIYDKGHMVSFEDIADSQLAAVESFYMTNIVPQVSANNRGIWKALEYRTRKMTSLKGESYVISGTIFKSPVKTLVDKTPIPTAFFKVIIFPLTKESYTFVIPNVSGLSAQNLPAYITTINKLNAYNADTKITINTKLTERSTFN